MRFSMIFSFRFRFQMMRFSVIFNFRFRFKTHSKPSHESASPCKKCQRLVTSAGQSLERLKVAATTSTPLASAMTHDNDSKKVQEKSSVTTRIMSSPRYWEPSIEPANDRSCSMKSSSAVDQDEHGRIANDVLQAMLHVRVLQNLRGLIVTHDQPKPLASLTPGPTRLTRSAKHSQGAPARVLRSNPQFFKRSRSWAARSRSSLLGACHLRSGELIVQGIEQKWKFTHIEFQNHEKRMNQCASKF